MVCVFTGPSGDSGTHLDLRIWEELEPGKPKIRVPPCWGLMRVLFLACRWRSSCRVLTWWREGGREKTKRKKWGEIEWEGGRPNVHLHLHSHLHQIEA